MQDKCELYSFDLSMKEDDKILVGVDEVGRGPLAGPVVAAAVCLKNVDEDILKINDSKKLSEKKREALYDKILAMSYVGIGSATVEEIDEVNILNATFLAMNRAIENLKTNLAEGQKIKILVDGNHKIRNYDGEQLAVIKGDAKSLSIAAASIIAKVIRDRQMTELDDIYPEYCFSKHKGYGTKKHTEVILERGYIEGIHRKTFLKKIL